MVNLLDQAAHFDTWQSPWNQANEVLYNLCQEHPEHTEQGFIMAKTWIIGRTYAAALERRKNKETTDTNEEFYRNKVVQAFQESGLDEKLQLTETTPTIENILATHQEVVDIAKVLTNSEKRSFASKYLHFHQPENFFIYDSIASRTLSEIYNNNKELKEFSKAIKREHKDVLGETTYKRFVVKCLALQQYVHQETGILLTPRKLDNMLLYYHE